MVRETDSSSVQLPGDMPSPGDSLRFALLLHPAHAHHHPTADGHHH